MMALLVVELKVVKAICIAPVRKVVEMMVPVPRAIIDGSIAWMSAMGVRFRSGTDYHSVRKFSL